MQLACDAEIPVVSDTTNQQGLGVPQARFFIRDTFLQSIVGVPLSISSRLKRDVNTGGQTACILFATPHQCRHPVSCLLLELCQRPVLCLSHGTRHFQHALSYKIFLEAHCDTDFDCDSKAHGHALQHCAAYAYSGFNDICSPDRRSFIA
jgi:hypothetical protein